jgi:hypothetical protein
MTQISHASLEKTVVDKIIELIRSDQSFAYFKKFYYGDPLEIPPSELPCVAVDLLKTSIDVGPTGMDSIVQTVRVSLMGIGAVSAQLWLNQHDKGKFTIGCLCGHFPASRCRKVQTRGLKSSRIAARDMGLKRSSLCIYPLTGNL